MCSLVAGHLSGTLIQEVGLIKLVFLILRIAASKARINRISVEIILVQFTLGPSTLL